MAKTLSNGILTIEVNEHGAELSSIKRNGREYLWEAYPEFWKRHSPVLFPIVGSVWNGEYRSQGSTYKLGQHGFARDMDFTLVTEQPDYIEYELRSSDETLAKYPYPFVLRIGYKLTGNAIDVIWKVENPSDNDMSFQIGAHPAFYWPFLTDETIAAGVDAMNAELAKSDDRGYFRFADGTTNIVRTLITEAGCVDVNKKESVALSDGFLALNGEVFSKDALILENNQVSVVTLCGSSKKPYLTLKWDAPLVGLWSPPGKNAPFVCIEPWYGRADRVNYQGEYEEKDYTQHLKALESFEAKYTIVIED